MSGAEVYGVLSGLPGLITGCISLWKLFDTVRDLETDGLAINVALVVQEAFFQFWLDDTGLNLGSTTTVLDESRQRLASIIIKAMKGCLKDLEALVEKYNLSGSSQNIDSPGPSRPRIKFWKHRNDCEIASASVELATPRKPSNGPAKLVKWVAVDRDRALSLVQQIQQHNQDLDKLLQPRQRVAVTELPSILLSGIHDHETLMLASLDYTEDLGACAGFKDKLLGRQHDTNSVALAVPTYRISSRKEVDNTGRAVGKFMADGLLTPVVLENKSYIRKSKENEEFVRQRVRDLFAFLNLSNKPSRLRILNCVGFTQNHMNGNFSFILEYPAGSDPAVKPSSLLSLIERVPKPPAKERIALAHMLASSVALLQACGILHKNIYEGNILFFKGIDQQSIQLADPFISGFDYARFEGKDVASEKHAIGFAEKRMHTHPEYSFMTQQRYKKIYDFYSLGILLLQIATWKPLAKLRDMVKPEHVAELAKTEAQRVLQAGGFSEPKIKEAVAGLELGQAADPKPGLRPRQMFQENLLRFLRSVKCIQEEVGPVYTAAVERCVAGNIGGGSRSVADQPTNNDVTIWEEADIHDDFVRNIVVPLGKAI